MAQRHRGKVTQSATGDDVERPTVLESARAAGPQPHRSRPQSIAIGGANGGSNHGPDLTACSGQPNSEPEHDDMDSGRGWHSPMKRGVRATHWFNNVMGVLLLVLAVFTYAVRLRRQVCCSTSGESPSRNTP